LEKLAEASFARVRPLGTAAFAGNVEAARVLLEAGADPNGTDAGEHRPLQTAEAKGDEELARLLRKHGATLPG
ncbi:MAG TPA: ankyrin repeat domain-containing protein, partial [Gaiellaceae bacterium]